MSCKGDCCVKNHSAVTYTVGKCNGDTVVEYWWIDDVSTVEREMREEYYGF